MKISFDYDGVLSTAKGTELAKELIKDNNVYIISARHSKDGLINKADQIGIKHENVYAMGSNNDKIRKIQELGIQQHYDNNPKVIEKLGKIGKLFTL
jgi:soluble P-type ATPase